MSRSRQNTRCEHDAIRARCEVERCEEHRRHKALAIGALVALAAVAAKAVEMGLLDPAWLGRIWDMMF